MQSVSCHLIAFHRTHYTYSQFSTTHFLLHSNLLFHVCSCVHAHRNHCLTSVFGTHEILFIMLTSTSTREEEKMNFRKQSLIKPCCVGFLALSLSFSTITIKTMSKKAPITAKIIINCLKN